MRRCSDLHLKMGLRELFIAIGIVLSAAHCGLTSEDKQSANGHVCDCMPKDLCPSANIRTDTDICNNTSEVCCTKVASVIPINHKLSENVFKRCGYHPTTGSGSQITDQHEAKNGDFPWMVQIAELVDQGNEDGKEGKDSANSTFTYQCGGSLVHPSVILTGAHCVYGKDPSHLTVTVGKWSTQTSKEPSSNRNNQVITIIVHELYDNQTLRNDVALLFLSEPIHPDDEIGFTCIPLKGTLPDPGTKCFATIWRKESVGEVLKKVDLSIIDNGICQSTLRKTKLGHRFTLHNSFMCADSKEETDVTKDDGGSPLICPLPDNPEIYIQSGLVARVVESKEYDTPGVFVNMANFRTWIDSKMEENSKETSYYSYE